MQPLAPQPAATPEIIPETCPVCHRPVAPGEYFCPNCGHELHLKPPSALQQAWVYFVSLFLPPFGLWYTWRYLKAGDKKSKTVGIMTIILTIVSVIVSVWLWQALIQPFIANYTNQQNQLLNQQLNQFGL